ncbi:hypothetical protein [Halomonas sp. CKK8]|nr:hypothetical protein [Halomonas sp. CKK8]WFM73102.1 hypothetical protein P8934_08910 [Halomonas sp. CKK8]
MSDLVKERELATSLNSPVVDGKRKVQQVTPPDADVGYMVAK